MAKVDLECEVTEYSVHNTASADCPEDGNSFNIDSFREDFEIRIMSQPNEDELQFDILNAPPSLVNALRRILLADVPSMAIEQVRLRDNTTILQDEFMAHRLGLIPFKVDPTKFMFRPREERPEITNSNNCLLFSLKIIGGKRDKLLESGVWEVEKNVLTKHLQWIPLDGQAELFKDNPPRPVFDDILIGKVTPKQEIDLDALVVKGVGSDHAKFSPVATASYRLHPRIRLLREVTGEAAYRLQKSFSPGVIAVVNKNGLPTAEVVDERNDHFSRNVYRHEDLKDSVRTSLLKNHYIFSVESTGCRAPNVLVEEAFDLFIENCRFYWNESKKL